MSKECAARTRRGMPCRGKPVGDGDFCRTHAKPNTERPLVRAKLDRLCRVLAKTGNITEACKHADIQRSTYYEWAKEGTAEYPAITAAWDAFASIDDAEIEKEFRTRLLEAMAGPTETWVTEEVVVDKEGREVARKTVRRTVTRGPARWALDIAAIQVTGGKFNRESTTNTGEGGGRDDDTLSDDEAHQRIRDILGLGE